MAKKFLLDPEGVQRLLLKRFRHQCQSWLQGNETTWPQSVPLGIPTENQALGRVAEVRRWQESWQQWRSGGEVWWTERRWTSLGRQRLPERLILDSPEELADVIDMKEQWLLATRRFQALTTLWPQLAEGLDLSFDVLSSWSEPEFQHLVQVVDWLATHQGSDLYIRQVPIPGTDSKWLETRKKLITRWLACIRGQSSNIDLYQLTGIRRLPHTLRVMFLDSDLRKTYGGLHDIQVPVSELAALQVPVRTVFIVENLQTGLAFSDLAGSLVFMKQGYAVDAFGELPWLKDVDCFYWGDIDTHGFAILDRLRHYLPHARSLLMDRQTLLHHRDYWSIEPQTSNAQLTKLTTEEQYLFDELKQGRYGSCVRLEQERIGWDYAWEQIRGIVPS